MRWLVPVAALLTVPFTSWADSAASPEVRLYAMDCGRAEFEDLGPFADTGEYDGHPGTLMASCFLIRHPKGDLLWDSGLGDRYANEPAGVKLPNFRAVVRRTVESQLRAVGLGFDDIEFFAFSHGHADHLGNANRLGKAQWIANEKELACLAATPPTGRTNPSLASTRDPARTKPIDGDYDVFGDGKVRILSAPGHTPGHQVLLVELEHRGAVLLSGDLYHTRENRKRRRMPTFNVNRADTLAAMDRIEHILRNRRAKLIIQHSIEDFESLPHAPEYMN